MSDQPPVTVQRLDAPKFTPSSDLTAREMTSLEKIAVLRGLCGKYRRALRDIADFPERAADIAKRALEERADG